MIDFKDIKKKWIKDPEFVEEYEKHRLNFEIAIELTQAREKAKITQKKLAEATGISASCLNGLLKAKWRMTIK